MLTATLPSRYRSQARNFVITAIAYSLGLFGLLKWGWLEAHAVWPLTQYQAGLSEALFGAPALPIDVTLACSGTDAFALCAGALLAYPSTWRFRLGGIAAGFALIVFINVVRIGSLGRAAASPLLFETLHVYVWPAFIILAIAGYVFTWMRVANTRSQAPAEQRPFTTGRTSAFIVWTVIFVALFIATSPMYLESPAVLAVATLIAQAAAALLGMIGLTATASANVLWTSRGGFEVTQECISTPLIPLYGAAVMTYGTRLRWRLLLLAAAVPLFAALGVARLLVVALPAALIGSPLFLIHAFYQILLAAVVVGALATWCRGAVPVRVIGIACLIGALTAWVLAPLYASIFSALGLGIPFNDAQGAMASLPSFQMGLYVALSIASMTMLSRRACTIGLVSLAGLQAAVFGIALSVSQRTDFVPHIRDVRAWAVVAPLAIVLMMLVSHDRSRD